MAGRGEHMASERQIKALERQRQALELRKAGVDYRAIAERLGYRSVASAHEAVKTALRRTLQEPADELREMELSRLDQMLLGLWPKATKGDTWAVDRVLKIMERRASLLGLDARAKRELTGKDGAPLAHRLIGDGPDFSKLSMEERFSLDQMFAKLADEA